MTNTDIMDAIDDLRGEFPHDLMDDIDVDQFKSIAVGSYAERMVLQRINTIRTRSLMLKTLTEDLLKYAKEFQQ